MPKEFFELILYEFERQFFVFVLCSHLAHSRAIALRFESSGVQETIGCDYVCMPVLLVLLVLCELKLIADFCHGSLSSSSFAFIHSFCGQNQMRCIRVQC